jgi:hypothetical protein
VQTPFEIDNDTACCDKGWPLGTFHKVSEPTKMQEMLEISRIRAWKNKVDLHVRIAYLNIAFTLARERND